MPSTMTHRWSLRPFDSAQVRDLAESARIPSIVAQIMQSRGINDPRLVRTFLEPKRTNLHDPELLPGVTEAADRLARAVQQSRPIIIYGDYDVDGVCGTSILWSCLRLAGANGAHCYIPHRVEEGYGLNADALAEIAKNYGTDALVVTVDCGITSTHEAKRAREIGLELIITDHHTIGSDLPEADVLVHPRLPDSGYPFGELCGCGVAFKLAWQFCKTINDGQRASPRLRDFLVEAFGLVAMATIADMVPLEGENRVFVRYGMDVIQESPSVGLAALLRVSDCLGKRRLSTGAVSFGLAPRINAAGRLERAMLAVEMLTTTDAARAENIAEQLDAFNRRRQEIERTIVAEAREHVEASGRLDNLGAIVVGQPDWHPGVIGIVASRLAETFHRPSIVVALQEESCQGSGRSIADFNLFEAIQACSEGLSKFGGHKAAAGLRMPPSEFPRFADRFDAHCRNTLTEDQKERRLMIDAEVQLGQLTLPVVEWIEALEPYGIGNPQPILSAEGVRVIGQPKVIGKEKNHVRIRFAQGGTTQSAVGWNMAERFGNLAPGTECAVAFRPSVNEWNGRREVQLEIKDLDHDAGGHRHAYSA